MEAVKQAKRTVVLIGDPSSKRTLFFVVSYTQLTLPTKRVVVVSVVALCVDI